MVFLHDLQRQMPTDSRLTASLLQKPQPYRACWVISIFFTCFRREAPYLHFALDLAFWSEEQPDEEAGDPKGVLPCLHNVRRMKLLS